MSTSMLMMTTAATFTFPAMKDGTPHIPAGADAAADAAAFDALAALLADQRAAALSRLRTALASARYIQLLRTLDNAVASPPLAPPGEAAPTAATVVWDRWHKLRRAVAVVAAVHG